MTRQETFFLFFGVGIVGYIFYNRQQISSTAQDIGATVESSLIGWKNVGSGPQWIPALNSTEILYGLPQDLLARVAYQESHFRDSIIRGTQKSPAGALGIMQMMPQYFVSVGNPIPYTDASVLAQIDEAGKQLASLYRSTQSWELALAAYNAGLGNVQKYGGIPPFPETQNYVTQISADVPSLNA